jgi:clan AA aspartic protease
MLGGHVTRGYEAVVPIRVLGPTGQLKDLMVTIDTGFTEELSLPGAIVEELGLEFADFTNARLAGDAPVRIPLHHAVVIWDGEPRAVLVHCMEGNPLIGMHLLHQQLLTVQVVRDGAVTVEPLEQ